MEFVGNFIGTCFDAATFLQMNERKPKWDGPVCNGKDLCDDLLIDGYYCEILDSNLTRDEKNVILEKDGPWRVPAKEDEEENNYRKSGSKADSSPVKQLPKKEVPQLPRMRIKRKCASLCRMMKMVDRHQPHRHSLQQLTLFHQQHQLRQLLLQMQLQRISRPLIKTKRPLSHITLRCASQYCKVG